MIAPRMKTRGKINHGVMNRYAVTHWRQKRKREGRRSAPLASTAMSYGVRSGLIVVASLSSASLTLDFLSMIDSSAFAISSFTLPVFALA